MPKDVEDELRHLIFGITSVVSERIFRSTPEERHNWIACNGTRTENLQKVWPSNFGGRTGRTLRSVPFGDESWNAPRRS